MAFLTEDELKKAERDIRENFEINIAKFISDARVADYSGMDETWDFVSDFKEWLTYR